MGYTTEFEGHFLLTPKPPAEAILHLRGLEFKDGRDDDTREMPDSYNQWELTPDREHLQWDGNEKFYHYVEWLQYLLDHVLTPAGVTVSGSVRYSGEEVTDCGTLTVLDGQVVRQAAQFVNPDDLTALRAFRDFVLASDHGDALRRDWQRERQA